MRSRNRTITIADDDRARVPFAMIGALILVSSVALVVSLELQDSAEVDVDDSLAMERTASAANTALYDATAQATHDAALEPVTEPADTPLGNAISDDGTYTGDEFFERYVKLRIYLEAQNNFVVSGQEFREMETEISIDPIEDPDDAREAIEAVTLTVGGDDIDGTLTEFDYGDHPDTDLGHGTLEVEIDDIEFTVERDGEVVAERTQPLSVTVGTPLFDLHHLSTEYEAQLNHDFAEAQADDEYIGFDQYFASMLYPLAWERGYAQNDGEPITEVISNRHIETLANDALFQTQRAVFGEDDPHSDRLLTAAYACTLAQDANHVYETADGGSDDVDTVLENVDKEGFCDGLDYIYDDLVEPFSDPPDWTELASQNDYLERTETIDLDDVSSTVYGELENDGHIEQAIDRIYTVDVDIDSESETTVFPPEYEDGWNSELYEFDVEVVDREQLIDVDETGNEREYHEFTLLFSGIFERHTTGEESTDATVNYVVDLTISGEHSPDQRVTQRGIDYDYRAGPTVDPRTRYDRNFRNVPDDAVEEVFVGVEDHRDATDEIEAYFDDRYDEIVDDDEILSADDFVDVLTGDEDEWTIDPEPTDREALRGWLVEELAELETETSAIQIDPERQAFLDDEPFGELAGLIESDDDWEYQYVADDHYTNVPDKVRAELFLEYMEQLRAHVDEADDRHGEIVGDLDDEIDSHMNDDLNSVTAFASREFDRDPDTSSSTLPDHPLLEGITYAPEGAPAYLTLERVEQDLVPVVDDQGAGFAPAASMNEDVYGIPFEDATAEGVELRVAGEVLEAGSEADQLITDDDWDNGTLDGLETGLETWIGDYSTEAGEHAAEPFDGIDSDELAAAIDDEIATLGTVERQAIELGTGEDALDRIAANVSEEIDPPADSDYAYQPPAFRAHLEHSVRYGLDAALGTYGIVTGNDVPQQTELLGAAIRDELDDADDEVLEERLERAATSSLGNETLTATEDPWLNSTVEPAPNRVASGTPITDIPMWYVLTANVWHVEFDGEYARFSVKATEGAAGGQPITYVREDGPVSLDIGDTSAVIGDTKAIEFESQLSVPIVVPADGYGVGDRTGYRLECSKTYDEVGPITDESAFAACTAS